MTVGSIDSTGSVIPVLFANGLAANPVAAPSAPGSGGNVTLNITLDGLIVGSDGDFASITANGGRFNANGPFTRGNGGIVNVTATGPIEVNAPIEATTCMSQVDRQASRYRSVAPFLSRYSNASKSKLSF